MDKVYDKVWKLLAAPERWTKECLARDAQGVGVMTTSPNAVSWCVLGAAYKIYGEEAFMKMHQLADHLGQDSCTETVDWNNCIATHTELIEACKACDI
jgi:hypothetical protein